MQVGSKDAGILKDGAVLDDGVGTSGDFHHVAEPLVEEIHLKVEGQTAHVGVKVLEIRVHLHRFEAGSPSVPLGEHLGQRGLSTPYVSGYGYMHDII